MCHVLIFALALTHASCQHENNDTTVDVRVSTDGRNGRLDAGWTHDFGNGVRTEARGNFDTRGNWGASLGASSNGFDIRGSTDGHNGRLDAGWTRNLGRGSSIGVGGNVDTRGNWGVKATLSFRRKRRNTQQMKHFILSLDVNQCNFNLYDANRDGVITKEELVAVFGDNTNTTELFQALDIISGDGKVDRDEFHYLMSRTIDGC
ncbi:hypothetical protein DPMN_013148 [Dreissena polymorpha]|uniref:EF-hand domain-containing protein n=1 Tax=Dreissena polymorpha TaxID=45954 RepID=A0A9D4N8E8_DREPO|nr:hypothetical protein DPMN_013148 [Dreissena polymorpha]